MVVGCILYFVIFSLKKDIQHNGKIKKTKGLVNNDLQNTTQKAKD